MLTIVIPVKEDSKMVKEFLSWNKKLLAEFPTIVIDSGGGELLEAYADEYIKVNVSFWEARKRAYQLVNTEYIFNLDCDVVPGRYYLPYALWYLDNEEVGAVSTFFHNRSHKGKLEFGVSIWRSFLLRELYDYTPEKMPRDHRLCECIYMWDKLEAKGFKLRPSTVFAKHLDLKEVS